MYMAFPVSPLGCMQACSTSMTWITVYLIAVVPARAQGMPDRAQRSNLCARWDSGGASGSLSSVQSIAVISILGQYQLM